MCNLKFSENKHLVQVPRWSSLAHRLAASGREATVGGFFKFQGAIAAATLSRMSY
jgi:hypothetical protein